MLMPFFPLDDAAVLGLHSPRLWRACRGRPADSTILVSGLKVLTSKLSEISNTRREVCRQLGVCDAHWNVARPLTIDDIARWIGSSNQEMLPMMIILNRRDEGMCTPRTDQM